MSHGLSFFQEGKGGGKDTLKLEAEGEESIGSKPDSKSDNKNEALPSAKKEGENPSSSKAPVSPFLVLFIVGERERERETKHNIGSLSMCFFITVCTNNLKFPFTSDTKKYKRVIWAQYLCRLHFPFFVPIHIVCLSLTIFYCHGFTPGSSS